MLDNLFNPAKLEYFQSWGNSHLRIRLELAISQSLGGGGELGKYEKIYLTTKHLCNHAFLGS